MEYIEWILAIMLILLIGLSIAVVIKKIKKLYNKNK